MSYLLVLMYTVIMYGTPVAEVKGVVASYDDPYDCESLKAVLTGSTPPNIYVICVPVQYAITSKVE